MYRRRDIFNGHHPKISPWSESVMEDQPLRKHKISNDADLINETYSKTKTSLLNDYHEEYLESYLQVICSAVGGGMVEIWQLEGEGPKYISAQMLVSHWPDDLFEWCEGFEGRDGQMKTTGLSYMLCQTVLAKEEDLVWANSPDSNSLTSGLGAHVSTVIASLLNKQGSTYFVLVLFSPHSFPRTKQNEELIEKLILRRGVEPFWIGANSKIKTQEFTEVDKISLNCTPKKNIPSNQTVDDSENSSGKHNAENSSEKHNASTNPQNSPGNMFEAITSRKRKLVKLKSFENLLSLYDQSLNPQSKLEVPVTPQFRKARIKSTPSPDFENSFQHMPSTPSIEQDLMNLASSVDILSPLGVYKESAQLYELLYSTHENVSPTTCQHEETSSPAMYTNAQLSFPPTVFNTPFIEKSPTSCNEETSPAPPKNSPLHPCEAFNCTKTQQSFPPTVFNTPFMDRSLLSNKMKSPAPPKNSPLHPSDASSNCNAIMCAFPTHQLHDIKVPHVTSLSLSGNESQCSKVTPGFTQIYSASNLPKEKKSKSTATAKKKRCAFPDCHKFAQSSTNFCISHGGGRRCTVPGCPKSARGKFFCSAHGGGKRCAFGGGCTKASVGGSNMCTAHGGGRRCTIDGCNKSAQSSNNLCVRHGGGKRCLYEGCNKIARGRTKYCKPHNTNNNHPQESAPFESTFYSLYPAENTHATSSSDVFDSIGLIGEQFGSPDF